MTEDLSRSGWSWRRVLALGLILFLAHLAAIWFLVDRSPVVARVPFEKSSFQLGAAGADATDRAPLVSLQDPTVFALANPHGFSGAAWFGKAKTPHTLAQTEPSPRYLEGERFALTLPSGTPPDSDPQFSVLHGNSQPDLPVSTIQIANSSPTQSVVYVEGPLANRTLLTRAAPPVQRHNDVLSNSVVQIAVDARGLPISTRLIGSSGLRSADLQALAHARQSRFAAQQAPPEIARPFEPPSGPDLLAKESEEVWGEMVFRWHTVPPAPANPPPPRR